MYKIQRLKNYLFMTPNFVKGALIKNKLKTTWNSGKLKYHDYDYSKIQIKFLPKCCWKMLNYQNWKFSMTIVKELIFNFTLIEKGEKKTNFRN